MRPDILYRVSHSPLPPSSVLHLYSQVLFKSELDKQLQQGLIAGKHPQVLARDIRKAFNVSRSDAERLMRTELARVQTDAQMRSFEENGFEWYMFLSLGSRACEVCRALNGKKFKVKDMLISENAPPMHPNCRCSTAAAMGDEEIAEIRGGDKTGSADELNKIGELNKAVKINTIDELKKLSKSSIINIETYDDAVKYFKETHNVEIEGFEKKPLQDVKITLAGFDDIMRMYPAAAEKIKNISYNPKLRDYGKIDERGFVQIGPKGISDYGTGIHESIHAIDFQMSVYGTHSFSEEILKKARRELGFRKNSKEYQRLSFFLTGDVTEAKKDEELLAYSIETEIGGGKTNRLSSCIFKLFKEEYDGTSDV